MKKKNEWPNISSFNDCDDNYTISWLANTTWYGRISNLKLQIYKFKILEGTYLEMFCRS